MCVPHIFTASASILCFASSLHSAEVQCGNLNIHYAPFTIYLAEGDTAYKLRLADAKCHKSETSEIELIHITESVPEKEVPNLIAAQTAYKLYGTGIGLHAAIASEIFLQKIQTMNGEVFNLPVRISFQQDKGPLFSSNFIGFKQDLASPLQLKDFNPLQ